MLTMRHNRDLWQRTLAVAAVLFATVVCAAPAAAGDREEARGLVNGIAATMYKLAWPTAEYKSITYRSVDKVYGGYDLVVRLNGTSAWSGDSLWMNLVFEVRDGALNDMSVGSHNAILAPPFSTVQALGEALDAAIKESQRNARPTRYTPAPRPRAALAVAPAVAPTPTVKKAGAVHIENSTRGTFKFLYRWGTGSWKTVTLEPGKGKVFYWAYGQGAERSPDFQVRYDSSYDAGSQTDSRTLRRSVATFPVTSAKAFTYEFAAKGSDIGLKSEFWFEGWPHPYLENVASTGRRNYWKPTNGATWTNGSPKEARHIAP